MKKPREKPAVSFQNCPKCGAPLIYRKGQLEKPHNCPRKRPQE